MGWKNQKEKSSKQQEEFGWENRSHHKTKRDSAVVVIPWRMMANFTVKAPSSGEQSQSSLLKEEIEMVNAEVAMMQWRERRNLLIELRKEQAFCMTQPKFHFSWSRLSAGKRCLVTLCHRTVLSFGSFQDFCVWFPVQKRHRVVVKKGTKDQGLFKQWGADKESSLVHTLPSYHTRDWHTKLEYNIKKDRISCVSRFIHKRRLCTERLSKYWLDCWGWLCMALSTPPGQVEILGASACVIVILASSEPKVALGFHFAHCHFLSPLPVPLCLSLLGLEIAKRQRRLQ